MEKMSPMAIGQYLISQQWTLRTSCGTRDTGCVLLEAQRKVDIMAAAKTCWTSGAFISLTLSVNGVLRLRSILTWDHRLLNALLIEAKKSYEAAQENTISIYVSDTSNNWRHIASRPKRPLTSIVLDPGIKDLLHDDARDFLKSKSWYAARGIPFRRGYLLVCLCSLHSRNLFLTNIISSSTAPLALERLVSFTAWPGNLVSTFISFLSPV